MGIFSLPKEEELEIDRTAEEKTKSRFELDEDESKDLSKAENNDKLDLSFIPGTEHLDDILDEID